MKNLPIVIYRNWLAMFAALSCEQVGEIMQAVSAHVLTGERLEVSCGIGPIVTQMIEEIDENLNKYEARCEKNKENAAKRYERNANEQPNDCERNTTALQPHGKTKTKTKTKTNNSSDEELESVGALSSKPTPTRKIIPPKPEWVSKYFTVQGFTSDPSAFFDYWESRGWKTKTGMMKDWEAAARTWNRNEGQFSTPRTPTAPQTQNSVTDWDKIAKEVEQLGYFDNVNNHADVFAGIPATVREDVGG